MDDEQLYIKARRIRDGEGHAMGFWTVILQHLAMRGHVGAMIDLASWYSKEGGVGKPGDLLNAADLYRRAWRRGDGRAAQHMAMVCFNNRDLQGFRLWARRGAKLGDDSCAVYVRHFETRLPHATARKIGRHRPEAKRDH